MDFTLKAYKNLLQTLKNKGYTFITFHDYLNLNLNLNLILLRHDVDLLPQNSLATAKMEHELGIKGSYYFRMVPESFDVEIIREIAEMGHEVGYHYETMDSASGSEKLKVKNEKLKVKSGALNLSKCLSKCFPKYLKDKDWLCRAPLRFGCFAQNARIDGNKCNDAQKGNDGKECKDKLIDAAYQQFCENLEKFRQVADVTTICMHGSPRSNYDNRDIWTKYSYKELGLIGEPYFDIDFDDFFYLTDTGRRWDGHRVSVRDKMPQQERWASEGLIFRSTKDIIKAANEKRLPNRIMITVHPQRWSDSFFIWTKELVVQNLKNIVKRVIVRKLKTNN